MRSVQVYVIRGEKQIKRYTEHFYGPCDVKIADRKAVAVARVKEKFGRFHVGATITTRPL